MLFGVKAGRTYANHTHGWEEAIYRAKRYHGMGTNIIFIEAPKNIEEMRLICREGPGCHLVSITALKPPFLQKKRFFIARIFIP